jgi:D-alanyl-D-alanine carboxypeptidase/D-alanyl-D-alanine-endopeptidase (penicillin-binding protein 4)
MDGHDAMLWQASHQSEPLPYLINEMLKESDNVIANALFARSAYQLSGGKVLAWQAAADLIKAHMARVIGLNLDSMEWVDGAGTSRYNMISPSILYKFIKIIYQYSDLRTNILPSFPIYGIDGTLKHRLVDDPVKGRAMAKTGTMRGVSTLAGIMISQNGHPILFVLMMAGHEQMRHQFHKAQDKIISAVYRLYH